VISEALASGDQQRLAEKAKETALANTMAILRLEKGFYRSENYASLGLRRTP